MIELTRFWAVVRRQTPTAVRSRQRHMLSHSGDPQTPEPTTSHHRPEPEIFAHALVDHLFNYTSSTDIVGVGTLPQIVIVKPGPNAENFLSPSHTYRQEMYKPNNSPVSLSRDVVKGQDKESNSTKQGVYGTT